MSEKSKLHIQKGVDGQPSINRKLDSSRFKRKRFPASYYVEGILQGNRTILGKAITIIESTTPKDKLLAKEIIHACLPHSGKSIRVGITGVPGVGKSTFIESFGLYLSDQDKKIAVLAVDPSSEKTKGSILGDKTRMEELSVKDNVFIRPSPSAKSLGGVTRKTRETIILCEAFGYETIFIETVGVGQSETAVHSMVDFFLLLMLAGAGDDLQGIKRGIMEMADAIALTKADNNNEKNCRMAKNNYLYALHLFPPKESNWSPPVHITSSVEKKGLNLVWETISKYTKQTKGSGYFEEKRKEQDSYWFQENVKSQLEDLLISQTKEKMELLKEDIQKNKKSPFTASDELVEYFLKNLKK
jgi:LAO/AO transport system kinase